MPRAAELPYSGLWVPWKQLFVGHTVLLLAHTGPTGAMAQQFSSSVGSLVPVGTCHSLGCFGAHSNLPSERVIPADVNPRAALEEQVSLLVPSGLGIRDWEREVTQVCLGFPSHYSS